LGCSTRKRHAPLRGTEMPDFGDNEGGRYEGYGEVNPNDPSLANGGITPAQWAEYQARRRRDAILGVLGVIGGTSALGGLGAAMGGGAAAAAGSTPVTGALGTAGSGAISGAMAGGAGAAGGGAAVTGALGTAGSGAIGSAMTGAGAAGGAGAGLLGGLSARDLAALGLTVGSTVGQMRAGNPNTAPNTSTTDPNLQALMQLMQRRLDKSEPLYDSVLAMANGLLPTQYQKGGGGMG
jgi:hypothetical protein